MKYSFVVPIYGDGELADDFCQELQRVMQSYVSERAVGGPLSEHLELLFVNDGSLNDSGRFLEAAAARYPFVRVLELSRNFGQHIAITCGYHHASGDFVGMLNVDMEDPPAEIPKLLDEIQAKDLDFVLGLRGERHSPWHTRLSSYLFNLLLNKLTGYDAPLNAATLRVMNRRFLDAYNSLTERSRFLPGLESWLGFKRGYVPIRHQPRKRGRSSYNLRRRLNMALDSIIAFSDLPMRLFAYAGFVIAALGFIALCALVLSALLGRDYQHGWASTLSAIVFFGGVQVMVLGVVGLYLGRVLREVQRRPVYLVRRTWNIASLGNGNPISGDAAARVTVEHSP